MEDNLDEMIDKYDEYGPLQGELYGSLLCANELIDNAGGNLFIITYLVGFSISLLLYLGFFDYLFGVDFSELKNWFIYIVIVINSHFVSDIYIDSLEKRAYNMCRDDLVKATSQSVYSKNELIAIIAGNESLEKISKYIKRDTEFV